VALHPLNQQWEARAKSTGKRCERRVIAANVCWVHGLGAKQTRAKQQQRLALWEVQEARAADPVVVIRQEPEELLLTALDDVNQVLSAIKAQMQNNIVDPLLLETCGQWLDRLGRLGKVIVDGDLSTRLHTRLGWLAQDRSQQLWGLMAATLKAAEGLSAADRLLLWNSVSAAVRMQLSEVEPLRLSPQEVSWFTSELARAAEAERAAVGGWLEPEPDVDAGSDVSLLYSDNGNGLVS